MKPSGASSAVTSAFSSVAFIANSTTTTITYKPSTTGENASRWTYLRIWHQTTNLNPDGYVQP